MKSWKLGLAAAVMAPALVALAPAPAAAQSCKVTGEYGSSLSTFPIRADVNSVVVLGDLKIRTTFVKDPHEWNPSDGPVSDLITIDMKAPGFDMRQVTLYRNSSKVFTICNQEVTLRFNGYYDILVSIF
jgi:hypothetical protein